METSKYGWTYRNTILDGRAKKLAGKNLDNRQSDLLIPVNSIYEILKHLDNG